MKWGTPCFGFDAEQDLDVDTLQSFVGQSIELQKAET